MVLPERVSVRDSDECDTHLLHVGVEMAFNINGHSASALVQDGIQRLVVDQTSHSDSLLLTAGEDIAPVVEGVPAVLLTSDDMSKSHVFHNFKQIFFSDALLLHLGEAVRVDDLVSKRANWQVGSLRDVEDFLYRGLGQGTCLGRPELTQDTEEGRLSTAVRA